MTYRENHNKTKGSRRVDDPTRWCEAKIGWSGRLDSVPPDKGCEVLDGENDS